MAVTYRIAQLTDETPIRNFITPEIIEELRGDGWTWDESLLQTIKDGWLNNPRARVVVGLDNGMLRGVMFTTFRPAYGWQIDLVVIAKSLTVQQRWDGFRAAVRFAASQLVAANRGADIIWGRVPVGKRLDQGLRQYAQIAREERGDFATFRADADFLAGGAF